LGREGLNVFFTQDAGANLKLLFLKQDMEMIKLTFPDIIIIELNMSDPKKC